MDMSKYYHEWRLQELVRVPTGLRPPSDYEYIHGDGMIVDGVFIQNTSDVVQAGGSLNDVRTIGAFATSPSIPLKSGDVLRSTRDDQFITLMGDPKKSPEKADSQVQRFNARVNESHEV